MNNLKGGADYKEQQVKKFANSHSICVEKYEGPVGLPRRAANSLIEHEKAQDNHRCVKFQILNMTFLSLKQLF